MNPATVVTELTDPQADGLACVVCGADYLRVRVADVPVGRSVTTGSQVFACVGGCVKTAQPERGMGGAR
jgi:hypothetical protein